MDDELKIVIKAVLDDNAEKDLNSQLKSLNLEPISPKLKLDLDTSKSKKIIKNPIALGIFKEFGIKNRLDMEEISKAVENYQNALKIGNKDEIVKSYDELFAAIKGNFFNFTKSLEDHKQEFLNHMGKQKMYISPHIK